MPKNLPLADIYKERNRMGIVVLIGSVLALIGAFVVMAFLLIKEKKPITDLYVILSIITIFSALFMIGRVSGLIG
jgi:hypothetical protein